MLLYVYLRTLPAPSSSLFLHRMVFCTTTNETLLPHSLVSWYQNVALIARALGKEKKMTFRALQAWLHTRSFSSVVVQYSQHSRQWRTVVLWGCSWKLQNRKVIHTSTWHSNQRRDVFHCLIAEKIQHSQEVSGISAPKASSFTPISYPYNLL